MHYLVKARRAGIDRPMGILLRMGGELREWFAGYLDLEQETRHMDPEKAAWTLLARGRKGVRARLHTFFERINPFIPCATWVEVLRRTARYYGIEECTDARELEQRIFEHFANQVVAHLDPEEVACLDALMIGDSRTCDLLAREVLSVDGVRMLAGSLYRWAVHELISLWEGSARFASRLHQPDFWYRPRWHHGFGALARRSLEISAQVPLLGCVTRKMASFLASVLITHPVRVVPVIMALYLFDLQRGGALPFLRVPR